MAKDVFVCHAKDGRGAGRALCKTLERGGFACWIAPRDIPEGTDWIEGVLAGIRECQAMVVVLTPGSNESKYVPREVRTAVELKHYKIILTFQVNETVPSDGLKFLLGNDQWINAVAPLGQHHQRVIASLTTALGRPAIRPDQTARKCQSVDSGRPSKPLAPITTSSASGSSVSISSAPGGQPVPAPLQYRQKINVANPGVILILVDQSQSMSDGFQGLATKAAQAALAVNRTVYEIQEASQAGAKIKDRCMVGIIGYGNGVVPIASGMISSLAASPRRVDVIKRKISDGAGGLIDVDFNMPVWVDPVAENGTPMAEAFDRARRLLEDSWIPNRRDSFPPIVLNITDGEPNDIDQAREAARRLMNTATNDGNTLLFNAHISGKKAVEVLLPSSETEVPDAFARFLFEISSVLPEPLLSEARKFDFAPKDGARAFVFNAEPQTLIKLLSFGSSNLR
jgi:hypothetical protein